MNTANLQLEGLYLAVSAINRLLIDKGLVTRDELDLVLHRAEAVARGDERSDDLSPANPRRHRLLDPPAARRQPRRPVGRTSDIFRTRAHGR